MAVLHAKGEIAVGERLVARSITDAEFHASLTGYTAVGPFKASQVRICGQCWIYGLSQVGLDPSDAFPNGSVSSDKWGG